MYKASRKVVVTITTTAIASTAIEYIYVYNILINTTYNMVQIGE